MKVIDIKCWPEYFQAVKSGTKPFELRKNDRDYQIGDTLLIREWDPETKKYTGDYCVRIVTYLLNLTKWVPGVTDLVVLGMKPTNQWYAKVICTADSRPEAATWQVFNSEAEARAYCAGFQAAKDQTEAEDEDQLEEFYAEFNQVPVLAEQ